jgi:hypothetical protein
MKKSSLLQILSVICLSTPALFAADPAPTATTPDYAAMRAEVEALGKITEAPKYEVLDRTDADLLLRAELSGQTDHGFCLAWRSGKYRGQKSACGRPGARWGRSGFKGLGEELEQTRLCRHQHVA